jgi:hypothetical protein
MTFLHEDLVLFPLSEQPPEHHGRQPTDFLTRDSGEPLQNLDPLADFAAKSD